MYNNNLQQYYDIAVHMNLTQKRKCRRKTHGIRLYLSDTVGQVVRLNHKGV